MKEVTLVVDDLVYTFYRKLAEKDGRKPEKVMAEALFKQAGELALEAQQKAIERGSD